MHANAYVTSGFQSIKEGLISIAKGLGLWTFVIVAGVLTLVAII